MASVVDLFERHGSVWVYSEPNPNYPRFMILSVNREDNTARIQYDSGEISDILASCPGCDDYEICAC